MHTKGLGSGVEACRSKTLTPTPDVFRISRFSSSFRVFFVLTQSAVRMVRVGTLDAPPGI
jgi:hypothetical protein